MDEFVHIGDAPATQRDCTSAILRLLNSIEDSAERSDVFESVILSVAMNQENPIACLIWTFETVCQAIPRAMHDRAEFAAKKN
jgi:hypothetical protein